MKQVIKNIISSGFEGVVDSVKQVGKTISPGSMIEQAVGTQKGNEFTDYLKNVGNPRLTGSELEKKKKELSVTEEEEKKKLRTFLQTTPSHMRIPQKPSEPRPYEKMIQKEQKKAQEEQIQKQATPFISPPGKQPRGTMKKGKQPKSAGFETGKNIKIG